MDIINCLPVENKYSYNVYESTSTCMSLVHTQGSFTYSLSSFYSKKLSLDYVILSFKWVKSTKDVNPVFNKQAPPAQIIFNTHMYKWGSKEKNQTDQQNLKQFFFLPTTNDIAVSTANALKVGWRFMALAENESGWKVRELFWFFF